MTNYDLKQLEENNEYFRECDNYFNKIRKNSWKHSRISCITDSVKGSIKIITLSTNKNFQEYEYRITDFNSLNEMKLTIEEERKLIEHNLDCLELALSKSQKSGAC